MLKVNVVDELNEKRAETTKQADNFVNDVKMLMEADASRERNNLKEAGLGRNLIKAEKAMGVNLERKAFEDEFGTKTFTEAEVREFCLKYDLRLLPTTLYCGAIDPSVGAKLTRFLEKNGMSARHSASSLYVMAPPYAFQLEEQPEPPEPPRIPQGDPVLFYKVQPRDVTSTDVPSYYVMITKWGNDFTIGRLALGWLKRDPENSFVWKTAMLSLILSVIAGTMFSADNWMWCAPLALGLAAFMSIIHTSWVDGEPAYSKARKKYNVGKWNEKWK